MSKLNKKRMLIDLNHSGSDFISILFFSFWLSTWGINFFWLDSTHSYLYLLFVWKKEFYDMKIMISKWVKLLIQTWKSCGILWSWFRRIYVLFAKNVLNFIDVCFVHIYKKWGYFWRKVRTFNGIMITESHNFSMSVDKFIILTQLMIVLINSISTQEFWSPLHLAKKSTLSLLFQMDFFKS